MKKLATGLLAGTAALALSTGMLPSAQAEPDAADSSRDKISSTRKPDNRPGPFTKREQQLREKAKALLENGNAKLVKRADGGATVRINKNTWYEFPVEKQDKIFTVLSEFGNETTPGLGDTPGPLHNEIPKPDRSKDNSTIWAEDFSKAHFEEMFNGDGESMKDYYEKVSSGRYSVTNTVSDWVKVPGNFSTYGDNTVEDGGGSWQFIADTVDAWYKSQKAAGKSNAQIDQYLSQFDEWDRYDFDEDGDFNEPDGYLDHFQAVHSGEGEEAGADPDTIWSHRWYVNATDAGRTGPNVGDRRNLAGGAQVGDSKYFVGDYTVEPENGGLGVFAHEFGHDLGLPDYYDTAGGDNGTAFWTLMSGGSWMSHGGTDGIGSTPNLMGPEEKLELGWLDYTEVDAGESGTYNLGPSQHTYDNADQAVKVNLPGQTRTDRYPHPFKGNWVYWGGRGDNLKSTMTREIRPSNRVRVRAVIRREIEKDYDWFYGEISRDGGETWQTVKEFTGFSNGYKVHKFFYQARGKKTLFRFRYQTDGGVNERGVFIDDISIRRNGKLVFTDGAERNRPRAWEFKGFKRSDGTEKVTSERYYLMENRQYEGYDATLETGPYNFSEGYTRPNWVEFFPYQNGLLVWYVNDAYGDNNTTAHPGFGASLPVDARPQPFTFSDGTMPGNRRQPFDATFGLEATDRVCLHKQTSATETDEACAPSNPGMPTFDDSDPNAYYSTANPLSSVKVAGVGVTATVTGEDGGFLTVDVNNPAG